MRRGLRLWVPIIIFLVGFFFFAPCISTSVANLGGGPNYSALISPSYMIFQCGAFIGHPGLRVYNGAGVGGPEPFWIASSNWNCEFPQWML